MKYLTIIISMWIVTITLGSCASQVEILPGLCYENRIGTTLCGPSIKPEEFPPQKPIDDIWEQCKPFLTHPEPAWSNCMLLA